MEEKKITTEQLEENMKKITTEQLAEALKQGVGSIINTMNMAYLINQKIGTTNSTMLLVRLQNVRDLIVNVQNELIKELVKKNAAK